MTGVCAVVPPHRYQQCQLTQMFADYCLGDDGDIRLLQRLHANTDVDTRHLVRPLENYLDLHTFDDCNNTFIDGAVELGTAAVTGALIRSHIRPDEVDLIVSTTVTGVAAPSLEARIAARIGLRPDVKRIPIFGLGCVAGAAGIARLHDYLLGHPDDVAVLLSVELCSLTVQRNDHSIANLVATGLFGDGAAAVVTVGARRAERTGTAGPRVVASRSHLYPDTERTMGWDVGASGLKIVLDAQVPLVIEKYLGADVRSFLADHGLTTTDITAWVCHPGGPKVIRAVESELDLPAQALEMTRRSLAAVGNLSSSSVLHVLRDTLDHRPPPPGTPGLMMAMGPGFCSELVLLEW
ncbi:stilbene synthase [Rhodococcus rhodochrous KG-21]|uniref:Stilbene synthase n=1 Tax=Rhodococcus rhodochrous KG-21 TaxID=1441923 RepID=A0A0M9WPY1_RHORH|nr:stilbene synthase [Rhodococcus rhodochrous KG-21]